MRRDYRDVAKAAARAAADKKATGILVLDIRKLSDIADYMVIAGADSAPQLRAIYEAVSEALAEHGLRPLHKDGQFNERWVALDYGGIVMHLLLPAAREFYRLENLWDGSRPVEWAAPKVKAKKK